MPKKQAISVAGNGSDIRANSYDAVYARPFGQTADAIYIESQSESSDAHVSKPDRYYLLRHLGLVNAAEDLLRGIDNDTL